MYSSFTFLKKRRDNKIYEKTHCNEQLSLGMWKKKKEIEESRTVKIMQGSIASNI